MAWAADTLLERLRHQRAVAAWKARLDRVDRIGAERLGFLRGRAIELRRQIDRFVLAADARLEAAPGPETLPLGTDWVWRPDLWRGLRAVPRLALVASGARFGEETHLFHDCPLAEVGLRQRRNPGAAVLPPFGVEVEVFGFAGSFLSLALDLPPAAARGLRARHLIRLETQVVAERPLDLFARLNLQAGPSATSLVRQVSVTQGERVVDFDLAEVGLEVRRVEKLWLDVIFDAPAMNRIALRDLRLSRHPRAEL